MKKILSIFTLISLVFAMCVPAFAAHTVDDFETETIGDFVYEKDTNKIFGYTGGATVACAHAGAHGQRGNGGNAGRM